MTDQVQIALIVAIPPTLTALGGIIIGLSNRRVSVNNSNRIESMHKRLNQIHPEEDALETPPKPE